MLDSNQIPKISGTDVRTQVAALRSHHPSFFECLDIARTERWARDVISDYTFDEFGSEQTGGRGGNYVDAQTLNAEARSIGVGSLLRLIRGNASTNNVVVDMLGGDGLLNRMCRNWGISDLDLITCDASSYMVEAAWGAGTPALLQRAERPLFRTRSVGAVLFAYGTHHIDRERRRDTIGEACRILAEDGVVILHDFAEDGPVHRWFAEVVDRFSTMGHPHDHFTKEEISQYMTQAGLSNEVIEIDDPITATGPTHDGALARLGEYLMKMYGLVGLNTVYGECDALSRTLAMAEEIFRYTSQDGALETLCVTHREHDSVWEAKLPRKAIVGVGQKR